LASTAAFSRKLKLVADGNSAYARPSVDYLYVNRNYQLPLTYARTHRVQFFVRRMLKATYGDLQRQKFLLAESPEP
jgi:hypothetical protein